MNAAMVTERWPLTILPRYERHHVVAFRRIRPTAPMLDPEIYNDEPVFEGHGLRWLFDFYGFGGMLADLLRAVRR